MSIEGASGSGSPARYKYAIVRVKENCIVDFFGLIASKGYSDVSFVSNLQQAIARPDPNDLSAEGPSTRPDDKAPDSEGHCSPSGSPDDLSSRILVTSSSLSVPCTASAPTALPPSSCTSSVVSSALNHLGLSQLIVPTTTNVKSDSLIQQPTTVSSGGDDENENTDMLTGTMSAELLHNLFGKAGIPGLTEPWLTAPDLGLVPAMILPRADKPHPYKQEGTLQTRMKGWQREYIKEVINNGHYPTEDELKDIEQKCDLSRKQVLRFIAKRLVNPNRRPRVNHHIEKMHEKMQMKLDEEAEALSVAGANSMDDGGEIDGAEQSGKALSVSP